MVYFMTCINLFSTCIGLTLCIIAFSYWHHQQKTQADAGMILWYLAMGVILAGASIFASWVATLAGQFGIYTLILGLALGLLIILTYRINNMKE